jgi:hypothetical protein
VCPDEVQDDLAVDVATGGACGDLESGRVDAPHLFNPKTNVPRECPVSWYQFSY